MIKEEISRLGLTRKFVYTGSSMRPTFRSGQFLYVRPGFQNVRPGDILIFEREPGKHIAHRVHSIDAEGFVTQGDNNLSRDPLPVSPSQVIGRVEIVEENNKKIHQVSSNGIDLLLIKIRRRILLIWWKVKSAFRRPYHWVRQNRFISKYWKPKVLRTLFNTEHGYIIKYIYKKKTIAIWDPTLSFFTCRKPFDLVIFPPTKEP